MGRYGRKVADPVAVGDVRERAAQLEWSVTMKTAPYVLAAKMVRPALSPGATMPVLANILHQADAQGRLWLSATNLTTWASVLVPGQAWPAEWTVAVPPLMPDVLSSFPNDAEVELAFGAVVTMYVRGSVLRGVEGMYSFKSIEGAAFPVRFEEEGERLSLSLGDFRRMQRLRYAVKPEERYGRENLNMLFASPATGEFATDGYVLALAMEAHESLRMSPAIVAWLVQWNADEPDDMPVSLRLSREGTMVTASTPRMTIASWLSEGKTPDIERFRVAPLSKHVWKREEAERVKKALPLIGKNDTVSGVVRMSVEDGQLILVDPRGDMRVTTTLEPMLPAEWKANPIWKNFARVLAGALADGEGDVTFCRTPDGDRAAWMEGASGERHWCVMVSNE